MQCLPRTNPDLSFYERSWRVQHLAVTTININFWLPLYWIGPSPNSLDTILPTHWPGWSVLWGCLHKWLIVWLVGWQCIAKPIGWLIACVNGAFMRSVLDQMFWYVVLFFILFDLFNCDLYCLSSCQYYRPNMIRFEMNSLVRIRDSQRWFT